MTAASDPQSSQTGYCLGYVPTCKRLKWSQLFKVQISLSGVEMGQGLHTKAPLVPT